MSVGMQSKNHGVVMSEMQAVPLPGIVWMAESVAMLAASVEDAEDTGGG